MGEQQLWMESPFYAGLSEEEIAHLYRETAQYLEKSFGVPATDLTMDTMIKAASVPKFETSQEGARANREAYLKLAARHTMINYVRKSPTATLRNCRQIVPLDQPVLAVADGSTTRIGTLQDRIADNTNPEQRLLDRETLVAAWSEARAAYELLDRTITANNENRPKRADILRKRIFEGKMYAQIAQEVEVPIGTVMSSLKRGKDELSNVLKSAGYDLDEILALQQPYSEMNLQH